MAAIDVVGTHGGAQFGEETFGGGRIGGHYFDFDAALVPAHGAAHQQGQQGIAVMNKVKAGLHTGQDAIIVQGNVDIFYRAFSGFVPIVLTQQGAKFDAHVLVGRDEAVQVGLPAWAGEQAGHGQVQV